DPDRTGTDIMKSRDEARERRLARAARPNQGTDRTRRDVDRDVAQHGFSFVSESDAVEADRPLQSLDALGIRRILYRDRLIENLLEPLEGGFASPNLIAERAKLLHRFVAHGERKDDRQKRFERNVQPI